MKKDCYDCRAMNYSPHSRTMVHCCSLGYKIRTVKIVCRDGLKTTIDKPMPDEQCPKPRTYQQLINAKHKGEDRRENIACRQG